MGGQKGYPVSDEATMNYNYKRMKEYLNKQKVKHIVNNKEE